MKVWIIYECARCKKRLPIKGLTCVHGGVHPLKEDWALVNMWVEQHYGPLVPVALIEVASHPLSS